MTDCGLECDSNQCILDCWAKFLEAHRDCPCEVIFSIEYHKKTDFRPIAQMDALVIAMNAMESALALKLQAQ